MIAYAERIDDILGVLNGEFGMADQQLAEILLAARIDCGLPYPWLILETSFYSLDTGAGWFAFGEGEPKALPMFRVVRPRAGNAAIQEVLSGPDQARLFIEPNFEMPQSNAGRTVLMPFLLQNCLRVRGEYPKRLPPSEQALLGLRETARRVLDTRWRQTEAKIPALPGGLLYWAELLTRLSPDLRDWDTLIKNLSLVAGRRAYLFDRPVDATDWQAVVRIMSDSVRVWTAKILNHFSGNREWHSLKGYYHENMVKAEVRRLLETGVIYSSRGRWRLTQLEDQRADIMALIKGDVSV